MALRSRLRRAFTRGSDDDPNAPSKTSSKSKSKHTPTASYNEPPLKYRRPVAPEHKAHLEAFSWAKAWRRKSDQSIYSPMGSRMPSRKSSFASFVGTGLGRRSKSFSRGDGGSAVDSGVGASVAGDERPEQVREGSDEEDDVGNVGLSRHASRDIARKSSSLGARRSHSIRSGSRPTTADHVHRRSISTSKTERERPFSPEDLDLALKKSNLEATKEESDHSGRVSPGGASDTPEPVPQARK